MSALRQMLIRPKYALNVDPPLEACSLDNFDNIVPNYEYKYSPHSNPVPNYAANTLARHQLTRQLLIL